MAAAPYASLSSDWCSYHVFLSFRGKDTRRGFTANLYYALKLAGFRTFIDDEIERGVNIKSELEKAIQGSQVSIIVFSKHYASSRWCLDELVKILECSKIDHRHVVLPVFYDVNPSHVREQSGSFAEAFARHEKRFSKEEMDKVEQWRRALRHVASLKGMVLGDGYERQFIQEIVEETRNKLADLSVAPFPVGMDNVARDPNTRSHVFAYASKSNDVSVALSHGTGGIGNWTAIARSQGSNSLAETRVFSEQPNDGDQESLESLLKFFREMMDCCGNDRESSESLLEYFRKMMDCCGYDRESSESLLEYFRETVDCYGYDLESLEFLLEYFLEMMEESLRVFSKNGITSLGKV